MEYITLVEDSPGGSRVMEWSLVLSARGIQHRIAYEHGAGRLLVPLDLKDLAEEEIGLYERENLCWHETKHPEFSLKPKGHEASIWAMAVLAAVLGLALRAEWMPVLMSHGQGAALDIQKGEWWRTITALTLHTDPSHLLGNMVAGGLVILWLTELVGPGPAWLLALLSGISGNAVNFLLKDQPFVSVGSSTAVFGVIGVITGSQIFLRQGRKAVLVSVGTGLALLAMLGAGGERTDLGAHFWGFMSGLILGLPAGKMTKMYGDLPGWLHGVLIAITFMIIFSAWVAAFLMG